jgi:quercetin dioxygenase-like cupin family protein
VAPVVKVILAQETDPPGAPGRTLSLVRYTIAAGAQLPPHIHPGVQLASIESGTLTYTIVSGTATVTRKGSASGEPVSGPTTITLGPGDAVAENDGMVHYGANQTTEPVVILASLLTDSTKDLAVNVTTTIAASPATGTPP